METVASTNIDAEIRKANNKFESAFKERDAAGIARLYTLNGMLLPTGGEIITGRIAIQEFWQGAMQMGVKEVKLDSIEIEQLDQTAVELGNYTLGGEGGQQLDRGKYIVVWKKENDEWKLQKDIWNSSVPAAH
jgi:uncharacterized protein (TIGR02246 family)